MQREYKISLSQEYYSDVVYLSQYDDDYDVIFHVINKYSAADVGGKSAKFTGTRTDGLGFTFNAVAVGSSVSFHINTSLTACAGTHTAEIIFYSNDGLYFGSANVQVIVEKAAHPEGTIDADEEALRELAEQVQEIVDTAAAEVKGEAESWAVGERDGEPVPSTDPAYHNNAKYYSEVAQDIADSIGIDATLSISGKAADAKKTGDEISSLKEDLTLFDEGKKTSDVDLQWSQGFINNDGSIDTTVSTYHITRKIDASELNGGVITSDPGYTLYAYRYNKNGSFIYGYKTIGKVTTFNVPTDYFEPYADVILEIKTEGYENVSAHGFEITNTQAQIDTLIEKSFEVPKVVMVDTLVALKDEQFDVMYDNIFVNYRAKDIPYKEIFGNTVCVGMEDLIRFQDNTVRQLTGSIRFRNSITSAYNSPFLPNNVLRKAITVNTISDSAGSGVTRKILLIGDSWTAPGKYARELRNLFESEDEPMNITLLGTLGNGGAYVGPENGYHEGHGAYSSKTYCTKSTYNTYANAFYNPTTETFDFSYYMNNCGFTSVDDVFINLGINDVAEMQDFDEIISYWNIMINSIKAYNSNIKVFIGLCGLPAQYKYSTTNNNCNRSKARRLLFHERLISEYGNRESDGIIIVPLHLSIDTEHDFPTTQIARSYRDSTLVDYCTDNVHPSDIAYNKIADRIRTYIKYAETLI